MMVLDTNVLSALMRQKPEQQVVLWLNQQPRESVWITSVTLFEIQLGLSLMPAGKRRQTLQATFAQLFVEEFKSKVLSFDSEAASLAADLAAKRQKTGQIVDIQDTQIAGIVLSRRATLATRNTRHFNGVAVVNPWE
jgi:toxin FitB